MKQATAKTSHEWLRVLGKGMITIPKKWREDLGLQEGEVVMAQKVGGRVIIEARSLDTPYRIYTDSEIEDFLKEDKLPQGLSKLISQKLKLVK